MRQIIKAAAIATLLSACSVPTPEERAAQSGEDMRIMSQVFQGMSKPAPAAVNACISQITTGTYSEASLLAAGFNKGNALLNSAYTVDVSGPVKQGFATRPLSMGINVGPNAAINFQPGCKVALPILGNAPIAFAASAQSVAEAQGYSFTTRGGGSYVLEKGATKIQLQITRTIGNGVDFIDARMSKANF